MNNESKAIRDLFAKASWTSDEEIYEMVSPFTSDIGKLAAINEVISEYRRDILNQITNSEELAREIERILNYNMSNPETTVTKDELEDVRRRLSELEEAKRAPTHPVARIALRDERCENCRFADLNMSGRFCHRFPPPSGHQGNWPNIAKTDWCGEWKAK